MIAAAVWWPAQYMVALLLGPDGALVRLLPILPCLWAALIEMVQQPAIFLLPRFLVVRFLLQLVQEQI